MRPQQSSFLLACFNKANKWTFSLKKARNKAQMTQHIKGTKGETGHWKVTQYVFRIVQTLSIASVLAQRNMLKCP